MARKIKFRAWNKVNKTMYGDAINNCKDSFDMVLKHPQIYEVMQYTGLKDKNGIEIYEGDIVKICTSTAKVIWNEELASFAVTDNNTISDHLFGANLCEVIGNIYENPELLEV